MQRRRLIQLGAVALLLASCSATSDFFLGKDNRPAPKPLPASSGQVATNILWKHNLGDGGADKGLALKPAYDGGRVYAVSADGRLYAFEAESGAQLWREKLGNNISAGVAVNHNSVFVGTDSGDLLALSTEDGETRWRAPLSGLMLAAPTAWSMRAVLTAPSPPSMPTTAVNCGATTSTNPC